MEGIEKELQNFLNRADILKNEPMAKHTSFKIGGNAEYFIKVKSIQNLKKILILANIKNIPITINNPCCFTYLKASLNLYSAQI